MTYLSPGVPTEANFVTGALHKSLCSAVKIVFLAGFNYSVPDNSFSFGIVNLQEEKGGTGLPDFRPK